MPLNLELTRTLLRSFDFKTLFIEELGWDRYKTELDVSVDSQNFSLSAFSEKRGMVAFLCEPAMDGLVPEYSIRRKIERQVTKSHHEHLIIYADTEKNKQIWQWVKREPGKPAQCREHVYYAGQPGDSLVQKIDNLAFSLEEEEQLTIVEVGRRARRAFDVEKITKRFYDHFKSEHGKFIKFLKGIPEEKFQRWYVSVMLNRLMFIYFIQKKDFLDNNNDYLRSRLDRMKQKEKNKYYKYFLCPLFFEGFAKKKEERNPKTNELLGEVPYLDGGLFQQHEIEKLYGKDIQIADAAFDNLFTFFDKYHWHLDERPLRADNEINPDVLGYIFEKYINQKQMGAYYTKEDITEYISKNTIIPFLFDHAQKKCKIAFEGDQSIWRLLKEDPDRYISDDVKHGMTTNAHETPPKRLEKSLQLPSNIAAGMRDVSKRTEWNNLAPSEYALPTEIWREVIARRQRYEEIRNKLSEGEICSINDLITYNLDIRQFAQDVIENCEGPELLRAIYYTIAGRIPEKSNENIQLGMSVLDPTCGSGAFLFAALNILEPLYEACLERMEVFLDELESSGLKHRSDKFSDFRKILEKVELHPNRPYFIFKTIILNNLYGVDIMEEAIEICKLRLFLKLVAQIDKVEDIEPLPDIDFNIRAGNTLVGFASRKEVNEAITTAEGGQKKLLFRESIETMTRIEENAEITDRAFKKFLEMQTEFGMDTKEFSTTKQKLSNRLKALEDELDRYLAFEYGINQSNIRNEKEYERMFMQWHESHQPFHWFIEFYGIMNSGGFDVIIGNPPYVQYGSVKSVYQIKGYATDSCNDLYAFIVERSLIIQDPAGRCGMILPVSLVSTDGFTPLRSLIQDACNCNWFSTFAMRPSKLFEGADKHLCIWLSEGPKHSEKSKDVYCTKYHRWSSKERKTLFSLINYARISDRLAHVLSIPKIGSNTEISILEKIFSDHKFLGAQKDRFGKHAFYHTRKLRYFVQFMDRPPKIIEENGDIRITSELKEVRFENKLDCDCVLSVYCSTLFFWFFLVFSDCRNVNKREVDAFPLDLSEVEFDLKKNLADLSSLLMKNLQENSEMRQIGYRKYGKLNVQVFAPRLAKPIVDQIDSFLSKHYRFTEVELDFIINYDIKYRMGLI